MPGKPGDTTDSEASEDLGHAGLGPLRFKIVAVTAEDDAVLHAIERAWARVREQEARIPAAVFEIGPGRDSSCNSVGWDQLYPVIQVNLMPGSRKAKGFQLLERLLHQAAHALTFEPGRPVSSEGRWHGQGYRMAAQSLGLVAEPISDRSKVTGSGWSETSIARGTLTRYRPEIDALDRALARWEPTTVPKAERTNSRNGVVLACSCAPPRKIRLRGRPDSVNVSGIRCEICGKHFEPVAGRKAPASAR
jgi:hypothetical protein